MAHVMKLNKAASGHMFKHYERAKDEQGEYIKFGNQNIDTARTHENYNLGPVHPEGQGGFVRRRCGEVKCLNRKDVNVMCSWVVTAPAGIAGTDNERAFFEETCRFLSDRYGAENVVSAHVHKDEITPHLHFAFVPVVEDKKKGHLKVSAKEAVNRADLKTFHTDLDHHLLQTLGDRYPGGVLNEATKEGNRSIEELKRGTAVQQLAEIESKAAKTLQKAQTLQGEEKALWGQIQSHKATIQTFADIESIGKKGIGGKVTMTADEAQQLKEQAKAYYAAMSSARKAADTAERLRARYYGMETEVPQLRSKVRTLQREKESAAHERDTMKAVIDSSPELSQLYNRQLQKLEAEREQRQKQRKSRSHGFDMGR